MYPPGSARPSDPWSSWPSDELVDEIRAGLGERSSSLGLVLGSGLGGIADALHDPWVRSSSDIPGYPRSTVSGHQGRLMLGRWGTRDLWVVQGRAHLYEGYSAEEVTRPIRLLKRLGVSTLILTNAAGSLVRDIGPGDLVLAVDAVSLFFLPLSRPMLPRGVEPGAVWRSRSPLVDPELIRLAEEVAREERIALRLGVLVGSTGPSYETAAEVSAWRCLGGAVASMSTVPEAIVARELGLRCLLFSLVSNHATGLSADRLRHEDVVERAQIAGGRLARLLHALVARIP